jgi:hypothetical protein
VKKTLHDLPKAADKPAAEKAAQDEMAKAKDLFDAATKLAQAPVKHTIKIEPVK